jgi:glycyl-tRNA synthetase beta chain
MPDLLLEIRCEELPARKVEPAARALDAEIRAALVAAGLLDATAPAAPAPLGTPRRLAVHVPGVREKGADRTERSWGPLVKAAFGPDGKPTKAGEGFARTAGAALESLPKAEKQAGKGESVYVDRAVPGRPAAEVVQEALAKALKSLPFARTMRWPQSDAPFARPIRGLVALLGTEILPVRLAGLVAGRATRGHPFLAPGEVTLASADLGAYRDALLAAKVIADVAARTAAVAERARGAGAAADADLEAEVAGLVEWPSALVGSFDPRHLALPEPVLVTAMAHHLRFFPVRAADGKLEAKFVSVMDRDAASADAVRPGNERVLRARLFDADFFFHRDLEHPLASHRAALAGVDYQKGLGTLRDKSDRVLEAVKALGPTVGIAAPAQAAAERAAHLLKCDLLTEVVKEFPELQGVMGAAYARRAGEPESVAAALAGQYLPRGEWDAVLDDDAAALVSVAEKADALCAFFSIGEEPTGSADPYGLRRHALGLLRILARKKWKLSLEDALQPSREARALKPDAWKRVVAFCWERARQEARAAGFTDFLDALEGYEGMPAEESAVRRPFHEYRARLEALQVLAKGPRWKELVALVERTGNMARPGPLPDHEELPPEAVPVRVAYDRARAADPSLAPPDGFMGAYLGEVAGPVADLFAKVLVNDPGVPERSQKLQALLHHCFALFAHRLGDLRRLGAGAKPAKG